MVMSVHARSDAFHLFVLLSDHLPLWTGIPREISPMDVSRERGHPATIPQTQLLQQRFRPGFFNATFIPESAEVLPLLGAH